MTDANDCGDAAQLGFDVGNLGLAVAPRGERGRTMDDVDVTLLYFDGCPNWHQAEDRVRQALAAVGQPKTTLTLRRVETPEEAQRLSFGGSPTILVNGADLFAEPTAPVGLACRVYRSGDATSGALSVEELTAVLRSGARP